MSKGILDAKGRDSRLQHIHGSGLCDDRCLLKSRVEISRNAGVGQERIPSVSPCDTDHINQNIISR